jgi:outer membrane receptor protein involved in Fe transport
VVSDTAFSPRLGIAWAATPDLVIRASYDRVFQTPAVENLLLASSPLVDDLNPIAVRLPVEPSRGHFFEAGVTTAIAGRARLDVTAYRRSFTNFADDDVFLNTGVSFPVAFASADIRGLDTKLTLPAWRRMSGFVGYALLKGTADLPVVGGLFLGDEAVEELEETGSVSITQDQRHTFRAQARYDINSRVWAAATVRYGSGLPVEIVEIEDERDLDELEAQYGEEILERVDFEAGRVQSNVTIDGGIGAELWRTDRRRLMLRAEFANLANRLNVINFAGLFSGTAIAPPRSASVRLQYEF